jgi:hypothetical protein
MGTCQRHFEKGGGRGRIMEGNIVCIYGHVTMEALCNYCIQIKTSFKVFFEKVTRDFLL